MSVDGWRNISCTLKALSCRQWAADGADETSRRCVSILPPMIVVKETDDGKWGLYLDGVLFGDSKHRYDADHAKQILLRYLQKHVGETQSDIEPS